MNGLFFLIGCVMILIGAIQHITWVLVVGIILVLLTAGIFVYIRISGNESSSSDSGGFWDSL